MNELTELTIDTVPSRREFSTAWICYAFFALAVFSWWPAVLAVVICYIKRGEPDTGVIDSHYRWLISTFWWWLGAFAVCVAVIAAGASPIMSEVLDALTAAQGNWDEVVGLMRLDWRSVFLAAGVATLGTLGLLVLWIWVAYRVVRGMVRLSKARAVP